MPSSFRRELQTGIRWELRVKERLEADGFLVNPVDTIDHGLSPGSYPDHGDLVLPGIGFLEVKALRRDFLFPAEFPNSRVFLGRGGPYETKGFPLAWVICSVQTGAMGIIFPGSHLDTRWIWDPVDQVRQKCITSPRDQLRDWGTLVRRLQELLVRSLLAPRSSQPYGISSSTELSRRTMLFRSNIRS